MMPEIGDRPIADIKALDLLDALRKVEKRGTTETSHRLLQTCGVIFRYAVLTGRIQYNPTWPALRKPYSARHKMQLIALIG